MRVGLCWAGSPSHRNDGNRSLPRSAIAPLATVQGVQWVSFCKDGWKPELADLGMENGLEGCEDWLDTAKALYTVDLLITVDTGIAHCAGGLIDGLRVWLLVAAVPDMRWLQHRTDTPWYSRVTLYRQTKANDWLSVVERVAQDLQQEAQQRAA